jgi:hypothetical protein
MAIPVGSIGQECRGEARIGQRIAVAVSMPGRLCGCCRVERSRKTPRYKASSLRTSYGLESGPLKDSNTFMRPPQQGQGGGSWSGVPGPFSS